METEQISNKIRTNFGDNRNKKGNFVFRILFKNIEITKIQILRLLILSIGIVAIVVLNIRFLLLVINTNNPKRDMNFGIIIGAILGIFIAGTIGDHVEHTYLLIAILFVLNPILIFIHNLEILPAFIEVILAG